MYHGPDIVLSQNSVEKGDQHINPTVRTTKDLSPSAAKARNSLAELNFSEANRSRRQTCADIVEKTLKKIGRDELITVSEHNYSDTDNSDDYDDDNVSHISYDDNPSCTSTQRSVTADNLKFPDAPDGDESVFSFDSREKKKRNKTFSGASVASVHSRTELTRSSKSLRSLNKSKSRQMDSSGVVRYQRRSNIMKDDKYLRLPSENGDEFMGKLGQALRSDNISVGNKANRLIQVTEDTLNLQWLYCRHVALLLMLFLDYGLYKSTNSFGTYRVDMLVSLFGRIIDVHNFDHIRAILSPYELACTYCRLGWLNLYNPCKPEGGFELDLSRREERIVAKTLCHLSVVEPGDNWINKGFRWHRTIDYIPGWELSVGWLTEAGLFSRGLLSVQYYSGKGEGLMGCKPCKEVRRSMLSLVCIEEEGAN